MRILHVLTSDGRRGAETSALLLREELRRRGHDAQAVALAPAPSGARHDVETLGRRRLSLRGLRALRARAREADVVLAHGSTTLPACALALLGARTPFVYANIGDLEFWAGQGLRRARVRLLLARAAGVAARSPRSAAAITDIFHVPAARVRVIGNGRPAAAFPPTDPARRSAARRALGLPPDGPIVVWLGALSPEKRPDLAIEVVRGMPATTLAVVGDGPLREEVVRSAATVEGQRVRVLGPVDDPSPALSAADVLLLTSDSEGLPGVLIEAGLTGLPVVSTRVGFADELVLEGVTGLLVPAGDVSAMRDAVARALHHAAEWGPAARDHCLAAHTIEVVAGRWVELLEASAATSRSRR